jgi:hypothetical protein
MSRTFANANGDNNAFLQQFHQFDISLKSSVVAEQSKASKALDELAVSLSPIGLGERRVADQEEAKDSIETIRRVDTTSVVHESPTPSTR